MGYLVGILCDIFKEMGGDGQKGIIGVELNKIFEVD